jgi:site-specific DNA-methyltransferase (adenine-specific)
MEVKNVSVKDIVPYENNPRKNADAVQVVMNSIREFGIKQPLVIDENNVIVVGHTRFEAAKRLGYTEVPCVVASDLTEDQINAYRIADNKTAEYASWDVELLNKELANILSVDMEMFGFDLALDEEVKKKDQEKGEVPFTEVLGEEHNYIVLYFDNEVDWLQAQSLLDIKEVRGLSTRKDGVMKNNMQRKAIGRVMRGHDALEKLRKQYEHQH